MREINSGDGAELSSAHHKILSQRGMREVANKECVYSNASSTPRSGNTLYPAHLKVFIQ